MCLTDRHTTLRATSVAIGRIYAMHAMRPNNASVYIRCQWQYAYQLSLYEIGIIMEFSP